MLLCFGGVLFLCSFCFVWGVFLFVCFVFVRLMLSSMDYRADHRRESQTCGLGLLRQTRAVGRLPVHVHMLSRLPQQCLQAHRR